MGKKVKVKYAYCKNCKKEIENPKRRPLDELEKTVWVVIILSTLGFAIIPFIIYLKYIRKRDTCPNCLSILRISDKPFKKPEALINQISDDRNKNEIEGEKIIYCPFCGHSLTPPVAVCPYCQTIIDR